MQPGQLAGCSAEGQGWVADTGGTWARGRKILEHSCKLRREDGEERGGEGV